MNHRQARSTAISGLTALMLSGCTTMTGSVAPVAPNRPGGKLDGILVNMTKPVFTVALTPPSGPSDSPTGTLTVKYVADFKHRYFIKLDPAFTSSTGFDLSLGPQGQLTSTTASSTSSAAATVQMLGKLASTAVALGALDKAGSTDNLAEWLKATRIAYGPDVVACTRRDDLRRKDASKTELSARDGLVARVVAAGKDKGKAGELRYLNETEYRWLLGAKCDLEADAHEAVGPVPPGKRPCDYAAETQAAIASGRKGVQLANDRIVLECEIEKIAGAKDASPELLAAAGDARQLLDEKVGVAGRAIALARIDLQIETAPATGEVHARLSALYAAAKSYLSHFVPSPALQLADSLVAMTPKEWTRRYMATLARLTAEATLKAQIYNCSTVKSKECKAIAENLADYATQRARALGKLVELHLAQREAKMIAQQDANNTLKPNDYVALTAAATMATGAIDQTEAALTPAPAAAPKAVTENDVPMLDGTSLDPKVPADEIGRWAMRQVVKDLPQGSTDLPKIVIVIDHGDEK